MLHTRVRVSPLSGLILSIVFAALLSGLASFELWITALAPRYGSPTAVVQRVPYAAQVVQRQQGRVYNVQFAYRRVVIPRHTVLRPGREAHRAAVEYDQLRRPPGGPWLASTFVLFLFSCLILSAYFQRFGHSRTRLLRSQIGIFLLVTAVIAVAKALLLTTTLSAFWAPLTAVSLWVAVSFDRRTALLVDLFACFLFASLLRFELVVLAVLVVRGLATALFLFNRKRSRHMLPAALFGGLLSGVALAAFTVLLQGEGAVYDDLARGLNSDMLACLGGGLLSGMLGNLLREPAEKLMGHVSRGKLMDLTDLESPLLRKMATEAPGSWEHSRAMANLAEAAAASIRSDSLLTRVGAYYHDLGKTVQPKYFIENQGPGERSPHEDLAPEVSADAIMAHVVLGTKILREGGVPEPVVEFAYTHHGTQLVEYFWGKYQEQEYEEGEKRLEPSHFRYPGMKPASKETAILMLVDSIEAASRTINPPTEERFEEMIRRVVFTKLGAGQLDNSGLTINDLRVMTKRMASTLVNMYHGRVKYPWQLKESAAQEDDEQATASIDEQADEDQSERSSKEAAQSDLASE